MDGDDDGTNNGSNLANGKWQPATDKQMAIVEQQRNAIFTTTVQQQRMQKRQTQRQIYDNNGSHGSGSWKHVPVTSSRLSTAFRMLRMLMLGASFMLVCRVASIDMVTKVSVGLFAAQISPLSKIFSFPFS